jgi:L-lactate dehydrogenase
VVPPLTAAAPDAVILIATDPPDPLADVVRTLAPGAKVFSTGTWLDSLRFRIHLADALGVNARSVRADVFGEHGKSEVLHWSGAEIGGVPWQDVLAQRGIDGASLKDRVDQAVRLANINIIEGIGASQYGIGVVIAQLIEAVLRDEKLVVPVGSHHPEHGVTFSLPSVVGAAGVEGVFERSIATLQDALARSEAGKLVASGRP